MPKLDSIDYETAQAINAVAMAEDRAQAANAYRHHAELLKNWRIVYADTSDQSMIQTRRCGLAGGGHASSLFRGNALWLLDDNLLSRRASSDFVCGMGTYLDSNAASLIRSLAYSDNPSEAVVTKAGAAWGFLGAGNIANPYLYLWEALRHPSDKTTKACRETFAANHALAQEQTMPGVEWGRRYRAELREDAEAVADQFLADFQRFLDDGLADALDGQVEMVEAMLVRTKIIEYSSKKSPQHKMRELITFMHEELSTIMTRELIVCADILCRGGQSRLSQKLNSVRNGSDPFGVLRNCAWDLFLPRALDMLAGSTPVEGMDFYLPHLITFDGDVEDILTLTELRSIALHRPSGKVLPFFNFDPFSWISERLGEKRTDEIHPLFQETAYADRSARRTRDAIRATLARDREVLRAIISP
ncbi:MAG: hypothetical protein V4476_10385 [Pseudomonadota bacterium]